MNEKTLEPLAPSHPHRVDRARSRPPSLAMPNLPPHELYALKLQCLNHGYALFEPNPNDDYDRVRVGDVGYISEDGNFMKLFNAFASPASQENNGLCLPEPFEPIEAAYREIYRLEPLSPGCRRSQSVRWLGGGFTIEGPVSQFIAGGSCYLSCTNGAGAALITKRVGPRQKAKASKAMESYMLANISSWFQLVQNLGLPVQMHDLIFVRECTLTGDWANVSWNNADCESDVSFSIGLPGTAGVELSFWGQWQQHVQVPKRQGPFRETPIPDNEVPVLDQCIFLRSIRLAERRWYEKLIGIAVPSTVSSKERAARPRRLMLRPPSRKDSIPVGDSSSSFQPVRNAYDLLAIHIFERSEAQYALIDDKDIFSLNMYSADTLDELDEMLRDMDESGARIVTENTDLASVARLSWDTEGAGAAESSDGTDLVFIDESLRPVGYETTAQQSRVLAEGDTMSDSGETLNKKLRWDVPTGPPVLSAPPGSITSDLWLELLPKAKFNDKNILSAKDTRSRSSATVDTGYCPQDPTVSAARPSRECTWSDDDSVYERDDSDETRLAVSKLTPVIQPPRKVIRALDDHRPLVPHQLEYDQDSSAPTWSHPGGTKGKNPIKPGEPQPINSTQASQKPKPEGKPGITGSTPLAPFSAFPPPPPPNSPLGSVKSWMTALLNHKAKHKLTTLKIERSSTGEDHQPEFTSVCKIDGKEYARCTDFKRKGADEKVAQEALTKIYNENPELAKEATPNYLSAFNTYLAAHGLQDRIEMEYETTGEDHNPIWTCALYRDGKRLSQGTATTKNKASEEAARKAAVNWSVG